MQLKLSTRGGSFPFLCSLIVAGASCTACSSIWYRKHGTEAGVYNGTRKDAELIAHPDRIGHIPAELGFPLAMVDLPLSAALDTVLLPVDLVQVHSETLEPEVSEPLREDPRLEGARVEAKRSLTNFIAVLQSPNSNQMFYRVCAWFPSTPRYGREGAWANVWRYENGVFLGAIRVGNERIGLTNNQPVSIDASNVFDWAYMETGKGILGDFTARAMRGESNPQGGANGKQPSSSETNRTSTVAASRRSP